MRGAQRQQTTGFTLIELLVVVAIMLVLIGMIMSALSLVRRQREKVLASKQVNDIMSAAEAYYMVMNQYPPDTGTVTVFTGATASFTADDAANTEADSISKYLGCKTYEVESATKYGSFLVIHPTHVRTWGGKEIMVDPWGMSYFLDCVHVQKATYADVTYSDGKKYKVTETGNYTKIGAPYTSDTTIVPLEKRLLSIKAWSSGPDMHTGAVPYSQVESITDPLDQDNIASWR